MPLKGARGINRQEKREQERKTNKLKQWLGSFNSDQKALWEKTVLSEIEKNDKTTCLILDTCYMAAISSITDLELIDIERIVAESTTYIEDYKNKLEKGDVITMIRTQESSIKSKMRSLIKGNKDKLESIKELEKEYKVPFAELDVMWLQVKSKMGIVNKRAPKPKNIAEEELKEVIEETKEPIKIKGKITNAKNADEEIKEIPKHAIGEIKATFEGEHGFELPYAVIEKEIEESQKGRYIDVKDVVAELGTVETEFVNPNKSKLKILEQTIKVQGQYGTYIKSSDGVTADGNPIKDIEMLGREKESYLKLQNEYIKSTEQQLKELKEHLEKLYIDKENELGKLEEIEEVFSMQHNM